MTTRITQIKAPEARELEKKRAELARKNGSWQPFSLFFPKWR
jgi:hypothetical protein